MSDSPTRHLILTDLETSALHPSPQPTTEQLIANAVPSIPYGVPVEAGWWDLDDPDEAITSFVPNHNRTWVRAYGDPESLMVNRYLERLVDAEQDDGTAVKELHTRLAGNCLAGSNPAFDVKFLRPLFASYGLNPEPWHHQLRDLSAYAAGKLGIHPREQPSLAKVCEFLDVEPPDHTAAGDVLATGRCFKALVTMSG